MLNLNNKYTNWYYIIVFIIIKLDKFIKYKYK